MVTRLILILGVAGPITNLGAQTLDPDTVTFANEQTRGLINAAKLRHLVRDSLVRSYTATVTSKTEGRFATGSFERGFPAFVHEITSHVSWTGPNRLHMDVQGSRLTSARIPGWNDYAWNGFWADLYSSEPFFVPRAFNDSIQMVGVPSTAALHPLAVEGELYYRYAIVDTLTIVTSIRTITSIQVDVEPKVPGPSLVAGRIWLDAGTMDVVRMAVVFVGTDALDEDEDDDGLRMTHLEANLEYSLYNNLAWMPHRQVILARWDANLVRALLLRSRVTTTFSDYRLNPGPDTASPSDDEPDRGRRNRNTPAWRCHGAMMFGSQRDIDRCGSGWIRSDGEKNGIRFTTTVPPLDSLESYQWSEQLTLDGTSEEREAADEIIGDLARLGGERFASQMGTEEATGRRRPWVGLLSSIPRFNRVRGLSLGLKKRFAFPGTFSSLEAGLRYGISGDRLTGSLTYRRDAPEMLLDVFVGRSLDDVEPWTTRQSIGTTFKSIFLGWDDADYLLAEKAGVRIAGRTGWFRNGVIQLGVERQLSVTTRTGSTVNDVLFGDGVFQPNPSVAEGDFFVGSLEYHSVSHRIKVALGASGQVADSLLGGRVWGTVSFPFSLGDSRFQVEAKAGAVVGDSLPQLYFRLGGPETVPGYRYGFRTTSSFSSLLAEWEPYTSDWAAPVIILGVATSLDGFDPLVSAGVGVAFFQNWLRMDLTKGLNPSTSVRFDLYMQIPM